MKGGIIVPFWDASIIYNKGRFKDAVWALIFSFLIFSPFIVGKDPQLKFVGDLHHLYFPQFVEGYYLARSGTLAGVDFLTNNGASVYFLRPNIPAWYPPYQLTYLFHFGSIESLAKVFILILSVHSFLSIYVCMRLSRRFFHLEFGALLFASLYTFAVARWIYITPFYLVATLFPLVIYIALRSPYEWAWWRLALFSVPYTLTFLSGYIPLIVHAVGIALLFAGFFIWHVNTERGEQSVWRPLLRLLAPAALAGLVVMPLYLAILRYHKLTPALADGVWSAAHQFSYKTQELFALLTQAVSGKEPEAPHIILGLVPVLFLVLGFSHRRRFTLSSFEAKLLTISLAIFAFHFLLPFGQFSGLPDFFYYLVPSIGKMHIYGRFLIVASFFFFLAVALTFKHIVQKRTELPIGRWLAGVCIGILVVFIYDSTAHTGYISSQRLIVELLMVGLLLLALTAGQSFYPIAGTIAISFLIQAGVFSIFTAYNLENPSPYKNSVVLSKERREALNAYFKKYSEKQLIKFADLTSSIEKFNGVILNYPWMVRDSVKLSNYMGYELALSVDMDYLARFPYFGIVSVPWLLRTGADFVIYDTPAWIKYTQELEPWIDRAVPEFDIGAGYKMAKLKDAYPYNTAANVVAFDNGIVRVLSPGGAATVSKSDTDFSSYVRFQVESKVATTIQYELFPSKLMELHLDGKPVDVVLKDGLLELSLPPGSHQVEYLYKNALQRIFVIVAFLYLLCMAGIVVWRSCYFFFSSRVES